MTTTPKRFPFPDDIRKPREFRHYMRLTESLCRRTIATWKREADHALAQRHFEERYAVRGRQVPDERKAMAARHKADREALGVLLESYRLWFAVWFAYTEAELARIPELGPKSGRTTVSVGEYLAAHPDQTMADIFNSGRQR